MEQQEIAHAGVGSRVRKIIRGRGHKKDIRPFFIEGNIDVNPRFVLDILGDEVQHVLDAVRLDP